MMKSWTYYRIQIREFFLNIKYAVQRARRGYSDYNLWSIDYWFRETMVKMLREFADKTVSYPCGYNSCEEWRDELKRMASILEKADFDYWIDKFEEENNTSLLSIEKCRLANEEADKYKKIFFEWFKEKYFDLWD